MEPRYGQAQGPPLSTGVSFVRIDPGDWKLPQDNQRVSSSVFLRLDFLMPSSYGTPCWMRADIKYVWQIRCNCPSPLQRNGGCSHNKEKGAKSNFTFLFHLGALLANGKLII